MSCENCKKKKPVEKLPELVIEEAYAPSIQEIKLAYAELSNMKGVSPDKREMINKVYRHIFNEEFDFDCSGCVTRQGIKFHNFIVNQLKLEI